MNQKISGLYKGVVSNTSESRVKRTELELRVDVDGAHSLNVISGDFYVKSKSTRKYLSSFIFHGVKKIETPTNRILLIGDKGKFSSNSNQFTDIQISISANLHPPKAVFQGTNGSRSKLQCLCKHASQYFRTIYLEHDYEKGVMPLEPYETANLPSPSPHQSHPINIIDAFAEAGIEIIVVKEKRDSVPSPKGTPISKAVWTNSELQEAMLKHFTLFKDEPQWKLWLLSAKEYVMSNIYGITIGCKDKKRRGCAVFQNSTGWQSAEEKRFRLFIYVHELGHCFNLHHPWDKPQTELSSEADRYATLSWMNLPWRYYISEESRGGEAFWEAFDFQFSSSELMHLRHGFRNDVIFGGNTFNREIDTKSTTKGATKSATKT
jgi:hypothetical protein